MKKKECVLDILPPEVQKEFKKQIQSDKNPSKNERPTFLFGKGTVHDHPANQ